MSNVINFRSFQAKSEERKLYIRWKNYYTKQEHNEVLEALVYEHEHGFPLRKSSDPLDQLRHKALVSVLQERAQTQFLKRFLDEIRAEDQH